MVTRMSQPNYVPDLPDLIEASEYPDFPDGKLVRLRISVTPDGVAVLGDAFRPDMLERLLKEIGNNGDIDQMLCG
jgi:hypothetical protein